MTDDAPTYYKKIKGFAGHETVNHAAGEFKQGMCGTYQHCDECHLHRYLAEFDFCYNARVALEVNDEQREDGQGRQGQEAHLSNS